MFRTRRLPLHLEKLDDRTLPAPLTGAGGLSSPALGELGFTQFFILDNVYVKQTIDVRTANDTLFITGTPQDDTVDVANDSTVNTSNAVQGGRSQSVSGAAFSRIEFNGGGGNDRFTYGGSRPVLARGGDGLDTLGGGGGDDLLIGDLGKDVLNGHAGNDVMWGDGEGQVSGTAPDNANGSTMCDTLYGEDGDDAMYGGFGNDTLYGGNNNDRLNGGDGDDFLDGGAGADTLGVQGFYWPGVVSGFVVTASENGNDRLFGGANDAADTLRGGAGNDRLLVPADYFTVPLVSTRFYAPEDATPDFNVFEDARIILLDGYATSKRFSPTQTLAYTGVNWADGDVSRADAVFGVLQSNANGKTTLLKKSDGSDLVIARHGTANRGWNDGWVHMTDANNQFGDTTAADVNLRGYLLHEIGHNWQGAAFAAGGTGYWNQFVALSGWTAVNPNSPAYTLSTNEGNGNRWYLTSAGFASTYARTNQNEDFAESFAAYFTQRAGWTYYGGGAGAAAIPGKISLLSTWASRL